MADRKISDLTALTTPASGDYLPIVDISEAAAASKNKRITIEELMRGVPDGTAAAPGIAFETYPSTGIYSSGANQLAVATNGVGRLFVDGSGVVSVVNGSLALTSGYPISWGSGASSIYGNSGVGDLVFTVGSSERMRINGASGNVGIGNSSPAQALHVVTSTTYQGIFVNGNQAPNVSFNIGSNATAKWKVGISGNNSDAFSISAGVANDDKLFINASGSVGIGTTLVGNSANQLSVRRDSANNIVDALLLNNGSIDNAAGTGVRINFSGVQESNSDIRYAYIESATSSINNDHYIAFGTNAAGVTPVERARLTSSGQLLVGTSSARSNVNLQAGDRTPHVQIETSTNSYNNGISIINNSADGYAPQLTLGLSLANGIGSNGNVAPVNPAAIGMINFVGNDGDQFLTGARVEGVADGVTGNGDMPTRLVFSVTAAGAATPTERMRIASNGLHRVFSNGDGAYVACSAAAGTATIAFACRHTASGITDGTSSLLIYTNGDVQNTNNSYGAISDLKLKENVVDASSQWNDLKALQVRNYNFKEGQTHTQIGLVAQEVELVSPGLVSESPDRDAEGNDLGTVTKSVNYSVLYMKAVKALQEAMERIETLEAAVTALQKS